MNTRLTSALRLSIIANAMEKAFSKEEAEIKQKRIELGEAFYYSHVTVEQEKLADKLPREFFRVTDELSGVRFNTASDRDDTTWTINLSVLFKKERRVPFIMTASHPPANASLYQQAERIEALRDEVRDKRLALREELNAVVSSVGSVKALVDIWPEGKQFIPAEALAPRGRKQLPAKLIASLNKALESAQAF